MSSRQTNPGSENWSDFERRFDATCWLGLLLRLLDRSIPILLSAFCAFVVARYLVAGLALGNFSAVAFNPARTGAFLIGLLSFASFVGHYVAEAAATWREHPYWLDATTSGERRLRTTRPILLSGVAISIVLAGTRPGLAFALFAYLLVVDGAIASFGARAFGENVVRPFRERLTVDKSERADVSTGCATSDITASVATRVTGDSPKASSAFLFADVDSGEASAEDVADVAQVVSTQRQTRTSDGSRQITGELLVEFEPGADVAVAFVSFCPPFDGKPTFDFEQIAGDDSATSTATNVQPFGVRIEAKRPSAVLSQPLETQGSGLSSNEPIKIEYFAAFPPIDETSSANGR